MGKIKLLRTHGRVPRVDAGGGIGALHIGPIAHLSERLGWELRIGKVGIFDRGGIQNSLSKIRTGGNGILWEESFIQKGFV